MFLLWMLYQIWAYLLTLLGIVMICYVYVYNVRVRSKLGIIEMCGTFDWITIYIYVVFVIMLDVALFIAYVVISVHCLSSICSSGMSMMNGLVQNKVHGCITRKHILQFELKAKC